MIAYVGACAALITAVEGRRVVLYEINAERDDDKGEPLRGPEPRTICPIQRVSREPGQYIAAA